MGNNWISIKERPPKEGQIVIAFDDKMHHCKYKRGQFYRYTEVTENDRVMCFYYNNITHWQPELKGPNQ